MAESDPKSISSELYDRSKPVYQWVRTNLDSNPLVIGGAIVTEASRGSGK